MRVVAVSGNPTMDGTVDRLLQLIVDRIECSEKELVFLREMDIRPCRACFGCVKTNKCVQEDDWSLIEEKIKQSDVMILGAPTFYGAAFGINALTHSFLERWFALRHQGLKTGIKKVILAAATGEEHGEIAINNLKTFFNAYHNIEVVETIVARGTTPCYKCGFGERCELSAVIQRHGSGTKITRDMIMPLEQQIDVIKKAEGIAQGLRA